MFVPVKWIETKAGTILAKCASSSDKPAGWVQVLNAEELAELEAATGSPAAGDVLDKLEELEPTEGS